MVADELVMLLPLPAAQRFDDFQSDDGLQQLLKDATRYHLTPKVIGFAFDAFGQITPLTPGADVDAKLGAHFRRDVLLDLFESRKGFLEAGPGFHYVNPSGRHSTRFLRTGNVLLYGPEVSFMAFCLLPHFAGRDIKHVVVDTASISAVPLAALVMRRLLGADDSFVVDSFSSYDGAKTLDFPDPSRTLCLISASTSGGLQRRLINEGRVSLEQVVTMFYAGETAPEGAALCDVVARSSASRGVQPSESYDVNEKCQLCERGQQTIRISGDQFLPASPLVTTTELRATDMPSSAAGSLKVLVQQSGIRIYKGRSATALATRSVFLDVDALIALDSEFASRARSRLLTRLPGLVDTLISLDDEGSLALTEFVDRLLRGVGRQVDRLQVSDLADADILSSLVGKVLCVVAGAVESGRSIMDVSQQLRAVQGEGNIVYIVGVARTASKPAWTRLVSNLAFGSTPGEYPVISLVDLELPQTPVSGASPWFREANLWRRVVESMEAADTSDAEVLAALGARIADLEGGDRAEGLVDDVFLPPSITGASSPLRVRPGFVFWRDFDWDPEKSTQADVLLTTSALLNAVRNEGRLRTGDHNRSVVAAVNFSRFNDGAIQAALLRSALPGELDYADSPSESALLTDLLAAFLRAPTLQAAEALPEFALALATGTLRLREEDRGIVARLIADCDGLSPAIRALGSHIPG